MRIFILPLLLLPVIDLALLIGIGRTIGILPTVALVFATALAGITILRVQGVATIVELQARLLRGEPPGSDLIGAALLLLGGALLLTPGVVTDLIAFILLIPRSRRALADLILRKALGLGTHRGAADGPSTNRGPATIEGEFREVPPVNREPP